MLIPTPTSAPGAGGGAPVGARRSRRISRTDAAAAAVTGGEAMGGGGPGVIPGDRCELVGAPLYVAGPPVPFAAAGGGGAGGGPCGPVAGGCAVGAGGAAGIDGLLWAGRPSACGRVRSDASEMKSEARMAAGRVSGFSPLSFVLWRNGST